MIMLIVHDIQWLFSYLYLMFISKMIFTKRHSTHQIKTHFKPLSNQTLHPYAQRGLKMRYFVLFFSKNKKITPNSPIIIINSNKLK